MAVIPRRIALLAGAAFFFRMPDLFAGEAHCNHCRGRVTCRKVCRLVCEEKKVEVICWGGKEEPFCLPGPGQRDCRHTEALCAQCDDCAATGVQSQPKKFVWYDWIPGCATGIRTKNKLMKKVVTKKIPSYKWVVEDLCGGCERKCVGIVVPADAEIPPPPRDVVPVSYVTLESAATSVP